MVIPYDVPRLVRCPECERMVAPGLLGRVLPWHRKVLAEPTPCPGEGLPVAELAPVAGGA